MLIHFIPAFETKWSSIIDMTTAQNSQPKSSQNSKSCGRKLIMFHGKTRHLQRQGSAERAKSDIKDILMPWMSPATCSC